MDESEGNCSQQIIKQELSDEIPDRYQTDVDPLALTDDQKEGIAINDYNTMFEKVYIKEEPDLEEHVNIENESSYNRSICSDSESSKQGPDIKENIVICPEINSNLTGISSFQGDVHIKGDRRSGKSLTKDKGIILICEECKKQFLNARCLKSHIRDVHRESKTYCQLCEKVFCSLASLNSHIKATHQGIRDYKCHLCNKYFFAFQYLKRHIETVHDGIKKYDCMQCHKKFSGSGNLKDHIMVHHNRFKKYTCESCKKTFLRFSGMKKHITIVHQGIKRFECELCGKRFSALNRLKKHISVIHGTRKKRISVIRKTVKIKEDSKIIKDYECKMCQKKFSLYDQFKMHMFIMHGKV